MEVVLLAHITFNRIGSASGRGGFQSQRQVRFSAEVADTDQSALRELVIEIAEANGEAAEALKDLRYERGYGGEIVLTSKARAPHTAPFMPNVASSMR